ncbi:AIFM1 family protein [Megaselia abdita]
MKWILGALALGGLGGLAYLLMSGKDKEKCSESSKPTTARVPLLTKDIPNKVKYLLIGGGTASFSAFRAIKSHDARAQVLMISNELHVPYMRPPLSKELWFSDQKDDDKTYRFKQWTGSERSLFFEPEQFFEQPSTLMKNDKGGIAPVQGYTVKRIDSKNKKVILKEDDYEIEFEKCLIATGCTPKNLNVFESAPSHIRNKVMIYRTPEDFEKLKTIAQTKKVVTIIGSGFLGSELACSLAKYGKPYNLQVQQMYHEGGNLAKILPPYLSEWTTKKIEQYGVDVIPNIQVKEVSRDHDKLKLLLTDGRVVITDQVVVCAGCNANTDLASISGLETDGRLGGFVVNAELEARSDIYAAGDAACFYDPLLGRRRVEHHDHSVVSGRLAGENMTGMNKPYEHQSMFWSDLGPDIGFEGIGLVDPSLETVAVFAKPSKLQRTTSNLDDPPAHYKAEQKEHSSEEKPTEKKEEVEHKPKTEEVKYEKPEMAEHKWPAFEEDHSSPDYGKGVIFYMKDNKVVGILLWNIFNRIGLARTIIKQDNTYDDLNEVAKLFAIHS